MEPMFSYDDVAGKLMNDHFALHNGQPQPAGHYSHENYSKDFNYIQVSNSEIKFALLKQTNNKAPGSDNVDAIVIKNLYTHCPELLRAIFNK